MARYWYGFVGGPDDTDPTAYARITFDPRSTCPGGGSSCTIYSRPNSLDPGRPAPLSQNLQAYLVAAKGFVKSYPAQPAFAFVYTRT